MYNYVKAHRHTTHNPSLPWMSSHLQNLCNPKASEYDCVSHRWLHQQHPLPRVWLLDCSFHHCLFDRSCASPMCLPLSASSMARFMSVLDLRARSANWVEVFALAAWRGSQARRKSARIGCTLAPSWMIGFTPWPTEAAWCLTLIMAHGRAWGASWTSGGRGGRAWWMGFCIAMISWGRFRSYLKWGLWKELKGFNKGLPRFLCSAILADVLVGSWLSFGSAKGVGMGKRWRSFGSGVEELAPPMDKIVEKKFNTALRK